MDSRNQPLTEHKLLILDGSKKAIEIVEQARQMGIWTVVTDYNTPEKSPAKLAADEYFDVSTSDIEAVARLVEQERITGILPGFSDRWLPRYAEICERVGLPAYADVDLLRLFTDKVRYKRLLAEYAIPTVQGFGREEAEAGRIPSTLYPLLVKPADGSGSKGISICNDLDELRLGIDTALDYSWTGDLIIERYLPGREATAHWLFNDGEFTLVMLANRHMTVVPGTTSRLPYAYTGPSSLVPRYLDEIAPKMRRLLTDVGVKNGMMFMQGLIVDGVFHTYDIGYRITPTQEYRVLESVAGVNTLKLLIQFAVTGSMGIGKLEHDFVTNITQYCFNVSTLVEPGLLGAFVGLEDVRKMPGVLAVTTALREGDEVPEEARGQLSQVVVRTVGTAPSQAALCSRVNDIASTIDVLDSEGNSLVVSSPTLDQAPVLMGGSISGAEG